MAGTTNVFNCQTAPGFALRASPGMRALNSRRASTPRVLSGFGARRSSISFAFLMSPKGRAEHRAFHRARGATWVNHVAAVCERHTAKMVASDAVRRLRSAREWISRLAPCPRRRRFRLAFPFVRAVARTCTWAVRPCCRRLSLLPLSGGTLLTASQGSGIVAATAPRYPRRGDDRNAPRKGAG